MKETPKATPEQIAQGKARIENTRDRFIAMVEQWTTNEIQRIQATNTTEDFPPLLHEFMQGLHLGLARHIGQVEAVLEVNLSYTSLRELRTAIIKEGFTMMKKFSEDAKNLPS